MTDAVWVMLDEIDAVMRECWMEARRPRRKGEIDRARALLTDVRHSCSFELDWLREKAGMSSSLTEQECQEIEGCGEEEKGGERKTERAKGGTGTPTQVGGFQEEYLTGPG